MEFKKEVPNKWGYYWVLDIDYPVPFPAFVWVDVKYPFIRHVSSPCKSEIMWINEDHALRFGDEIQTPPAASVMIEK